MAFAFAAHGGPRRRFHRRHGVRYEPEWIPTTKLGRLVKKGKIRCIEEIFLHSLPIREPQIVDSLLPNLKDEILKIVTVPKQTRSGPQTRFKAFVIVGDCQGHVGLGVKCSREVVQAVIGAHLIAKMSVVPVRRGYWARINGKGWPRLNYWRNHREKMARPHTVAVRMTGKCGSVRVRMLPAPRGTGVVASRAVRRLALLAGVDDVFTSIAGSTRSAGNVVRAAFDCLARAYGFLTPDMWRVGCASWCKSPLDGSGYDRFWEEGKEEWKGLPRCANNPRMILCHD